MFARSQLHHVFFGLLALAIATPSAHAAITVKTERVAHGVHVWYVESSTVPVVDVQISFEGAGYASDPAGKEGRAALAAAMLTEGAGSLDALAFQRALDDSALQLNAEVSADRLTIHLHALRAQAKHGAELLAMALAQPQFASNDLARIKTSMQSQLTQLQESPDYLASRLFDTHAFAGHPYANPPYGTPTSINVLTADDLRQYLTTYVTRGNMKIAASGDVDSGLLDTMLEPVITAAHDDDATATIAATSLQGGGTVQRQAMEVPQTVVAFAAPAVARDDPKFYAVYLLNHILGGHDLTSRLMSEVRKEKGLVYGIGSDIDVRAGISLLRGEFATRNATAEQAVEEVKHVLDELRNKGVTTEECDDAKAYVIGSNTLRLDSSAEITGMLLSMQIHQLGEDYLDKREGYFKSVSCSDINEAARELLDPAKFFMVMVGGSGAPAATK